MTKLAKSPRVSARKDETIQIRASAETKAIINRAAELRGKKLSEFMLDSAREKAEEAILDQRVFRLSASDHERFLKLLDSPPKAGRALRARYKRKPAWQQ